MDPWEYEPARDKDLPLKERIQSHEREGSLITALIGLFWWSLVRLYLAVYHRVSVTGREHLPAEPGFFLVANHTSHLDALILASMLPLRWNGHVYPVAAGDTFFEKTGSAVFASQFLNALPLWRRKVTAHALDDLRARLRRDVLILFPEGTRSRDGTLAKFKPGIGKIVAGTSSPVVPCVLSGGFEAWPPKGRLPLPRKIRVHIGEPIQFADLANDRQGWEQVAEQLEAAVRALGGR